MPLGGPVRCPGQVRDYDEFRAFLGRLHQSQLDQLAGRLGVAPRRTREALENALVCAVRTSEEVNGVRVHV